MTRIARWLCLISLITGTSFGATWYVDIAAKGANDGSSWANAWTNFDKINWTAVSAGDRIEVAKGTNYTALTFKKSGLVNAPITLALASDPLRVGNVYMAGLGINASYIQVNGAFDTNFAVPSSVNDLDVITNNIGLHITSTYNGVNFGVSTIGANLQWLDVYSCGQLTGGFPANSEPAEHGISLGSYQTNCVIAYCYLHDNIYGDTVNYNVGTTNWGDVSIHDCLVYNTGDDAFQMNCGFDIFRCKISRRTWGYASGHTDCFQTWGSKIRIHHNIILNFSAGPGGSDYNSISYAQFSTSPCGDFLFYNNLIYNDDTNWLTAPGLALSFDAWWATNKLLTNQIITNIVLANNLFNLPNAQISGWTLYGAATDSSRGTNYAHTITNCLIANNIVVDSYNWTAGELGGVAWGIPGPVTNPVPVNAGDPASIYVTASSIPLQNNIVKGPNSRVSYMNTISADVISATKPFGFVNWTNLPAFAAYTPLGASVPKNTNDFHLKTSDTAARGNGLNLNSFKTMMPMIDMDLDARSRPANGAWDIGPYAYGSPNNLLLRISFEDVNWSKGFFEDKSGRGNNGWEFGHGGQTNWPTRAFRRPGVPVGVFKYAMDPTIPVTGKAGAYVAVTNVSDFPTTNQMTICAWAFYDASSDTNGNLQNWSWDQHATILSAGYANTNAWSLGRDGNRMPCFEYYTNNAAGQRQQFNFPDTFNINGLSDTWHHYAVVWSNATVTLYFDGVPYSTNTAVQNTIGVAGGWIGIGCNTHGASVWSTPRFGDDNYPNDGWMNGKIGDVRIYGSALTAPQIQQVYSAAPGSVSMAPPKNLRFR